MANENDEMTPAEIGRWGEFCCWVTLVMAPILYWFNGPSVSSDQFVVRSGLVIVAIVGAVGFRTHAWWNRKRK